MKITLGLLFILSLQGCVSSMDEQIDKDLGLGFNNVCLGRYQMDLIDTMKMSSVMYGNGDISLYWRDPEEGEKGMFSGDARYQNWLDYVHRKKGNDEFFHVNSTEGVSIIVGYSFFHDEFNSGRKNHFLNGYFYKDFPKVKKSLGFDVNGGDSYGVYPVKDVNYKKKYYLYLKEISIYPKSLIYLLWPHSQLGVCLTPEFTLNVAKAGGETHYRTVYWNGKNDRFQMTARVMESREQLNKKRGMAQKLFGLFASKNLDLAGRDGQLFLSDARYAEDGLEFRWVTTDAKIGSTARPYIELEGTVDMANYPKLKQVGMDARDIIVIMLKTFRVRENGLIGTS
ncbi:hypothetical protein [Pelagibaculum spongiae]|uniref:Tle cognate immunity protein 4 C-terminal domain-containing protein n=1 Tax=Pelagibaculum spongiae TaxID=2080658 RepID=A0A2V1GWQ2_9GAMM|nr:hypothetical protein [Pelagibaculum spongiae]PVZ71611.1 hypothetical protein DC094_00805 [Pelagibaculum spongiae]